jgi:NAD-dependent dihydropyrimidine dehydrogenase PreA subunit
MDEEGAVALVGYAADCISCFRCELRCPVDCIEVAPAAPARESDPMFVVPLEGAP